MAYWRTSTGSQRSRSEDSGDIIETFIDYCFNINLLATNDIDTYIGECVIGNEADNFEMFTNELIQEIISKEEEIMLIFAEEFDEFEDADGFMNCVESDEDVDSITDHVEEEEIDPS